MSDLCEGLVAAALGVRDLQKWINVGDVDRTRMQIVSRSRPGKMQSLYISCGGHLNLDPQKCIQFASWLTTNSIPLLTQEFKVAIDHWLVMSDLVAHISCIQNQT